MALSKDDRISFSKKIVSADSETASIDSSKAQILVQKTIAEKLDLAHKNLIDEKNVPINGYQTEISLLDGSLRTTLSESDIQDSANFVVGNSFYPNNTASLPPSISPNIWTKTKPFALNKAIGKTYLEAAAGTTTKESDLVALVTSAITAIETSYVAMERVTGQQCTNPGGGSCSIPIYTTQATCVANGGTWTPSADVIASYAAVQNALTDLVTKVNNLKTFLTTESSSIYVLDTNSTRQTESLAAKNNIDNVILSAINTWLAYNNFNTAHGQTTCVGFYSYNSNLLGPTKLRATELNALKAAFTARSTFVSSRITQLQGYFGTLSQNLSTGDVTGSGLYYERYQFLKLRLNLLGGSLTALKGFERAVTAQDEQKTSIADAKSTYSSVMVCSALAAPANGTKYLTLKSAEGLSVGDSIFIVTDTQEEIVRGIQQIDGNRLLLNQEVSPRYLESDFGRVYKLL